MEAQFRFRFTSELRLAKHRGFESLGPRAADPAQGAQKGAILASALETKRNRPRGGSPSTS